MFRALVANLLSIHYQFRELTLHLFSVLRIRCLFRESTKNFLSFSLWVHLFVNSPSNSRTRYLFRESTMNWLSVWPLHHEFTVFFATQLWIDFAFQELSIMIIYNEFTVCLAIALWISEYFMNSLSIPEFTIYLAIRSWMYLVFREVTINSLSFSRMYYKFTVFNVNLVRIHLMFSEFTMNSVGVSRIYY